MIHDPSNRLDNACPARAWVHLWSLGNRKSLITAANEKESFMENSKYEEKADFRMPAMNLLSLEVGELIVDTMGLRGHPSLCTLGSPKNLGAMALYVVSDFASCSEIKLSFCNFFTILLFSF